MSPLYIGCAGWTLPRDYWPLFPDTGTHLQRYATQLPAVEINSSFYRPHQPQTYLRWAQSVPSTFRFSVKLPKLITHVQRLQHCEGLLDEFLAQCLKLGDRLGCLLIQLPPSLAHDATLAAEFFRMLRQRYAGTVVLEPRHETWRAASGLLIEHRIGRVAADPSPITGGTTPGGWSGVRYWRLHGSPRIYYSDYDLGRLQVLAQRMRSSMEEGAETWCVFDNTASGFALGNALSLRALLEPSG
ncbi:DUF72 domain-containing protein [Pseudomonas sp. ADAK2]|uniref:DUF72 domain-containing protein n=1 Tax=unclassified Pseudomonas TaxID=196821 RepID=UPI001462F6AD|nr:MULTISPECIES: DUF72 domain-containing protein [unclassified Pseudomonas]QJI40838.1 DUF72 domain-containing protein [Pseudomonas sp. ADAK7]QJI47142.1 DUF72 domain-containing protein [Pseudomonas sp. ADAK2]